MNAFLRPRPDVIVDGLASLIPRIVIIEIINKSICGSHFDRDLFFIGF